MTIDYGRYLTLGGIIERLEKEDQDRVLPFGFDEPHSYRGHYEQLAFEPAWNIRIGDMLAAARSALGATFPGWKGGDYTMSTHTDCWIANEGTDSDNRIGPVLLELLLAPSPWTLIPDEAVEAVAAAMTLYDYENGVSDHPGVSDDDRGKARRVLGVAAPFIAAGTRGDTP